MRIHSVDPRAVALSTIVPGYKNYRGYKVIK